jgi:hypothetical protein
MNKLAPAFKFLLMALLWFLALTAFYILVAVFSPWLSGNDLIMERLMIGFIPFLQNNFSEISWNARTWGPGLGAFLVALVFSHRYLSKWAERSGRQWSFLTSFCLFMIVPVLFVISFIVPGVLLQWEVLRETGWIDIW